jgi:dTDP-4-dehydrorhamnose reductase
VILVTGVSSLPGWGITYELSKAGYDVLGVYKDHPVEGIQAIRYDLLQDPKGIVKLYKPNVLIHVASIGNVDLCEENRELCFRFNVIASRELMVEAYRVGCKIIYLSTDYVFDGYKGLYREEDTPRPINFYGLTKLIAEQIALSLNGSVIRVSAVYGPGPGRPNFAKVVWEKLSKGETVEAAVDQFLSPTFNLHIGRALARILRLRRDIDILHVAGPRLSRYDYALLVARVFNLKNDLIKLTTMDKIPYKAPRPRDSSLDNSRAKRYTELSLNDVESALKEYESYQQFSKF